MAKYSCHILQHTRKILGKGRNIENSAEIQHIEQDITNIQQGMAHFQILPFGTYKDELESCAFKLGSSYTPVTYKLAAKTMSRFIAFEAVSIFLYRAELPIIDAAFLNSRHVSSSLTMVRTIMPSGTSVSSQISANGVPCR